MVRSLVQVLPSEPALPLAAWCSPVALSQVWPRRGELRHSPAEPLLSVAVLPLQVLQARIQDKARSERDAKEAAERKGLIGSGDRSDRIRTYNFPQGRLTDHRINLTLYKLLAVMEGDLGDVLEALAHAREAELLEEFEVGAL